MLRSRIASSRSSGNSSAGLRKAVPALLTRTSTCPSSPTIASTVAPTAARSDIAVGGARLAALRRDRRCRGGGAVVVDVDHHDASSGLGEALGNRGSNAAATTGDAGHAPTESEEALHESGRDFEVRGT